MAFKHFLPIVVVIVLLSCSPGKEDAADILDGRSSSSLENAGAVTSSSDREKDVSTDPGNPVSRELLYREALKKHLDKDPSIRRQIEEYKKDLLTQSYLEYYLSDKVTVSEEEILEYYRENRESFRLRQDRARIVHYLFDSSDDANSSKRILLYGDQTQKNSLTERFMPEERSVIQGMLIQELDDAVFVEGRQIQILGPIRSEFGYHIIDVREYLRSGNYLPIAEVRQLIRERIGNSKKDTQYKQLLEELKEKYDYK